MISVDEANGAVPPAELPEEQQMLEKCRYLPCAFLSAAAFFFLSLAALFLADF